MFNDVAIILINKFGIEGEVTTPSTLSLSLEVGFAIVISVTLLMFPPQWSHYRISAHYGC